MDLFENFRRAINAAARSANPEARRLQSAARKAVRSLTRTLNALVGGVMNRPGNVTTPEPTPFDRMVQQFAEQMQDFQREMAASRNGARNGSRGIRGRGQEAEDIEPGPAPFHLGPARERIQIGMQSRQYDSDDPVFSGEMVPVDSSNVHSIGYIFNAANPTQGTLKVRYLQDKPGSHGKKSGPGPLYYYSPINPAVFDSFVQAASKGRFVWDRLRIRGTVSGHRVPYELKGIVNGYVPRKATRYGQNEYFIGRRIHVQSQTTGERRHFTSSLPDEFVQNLGANRRGPNFPAPPRGTPNRGRPNRGRP